MKVGFFFQEQGIESLVHLSLARGLLNSVRDSMPGVKVYQLTDDKSPILEGVDGVDRCSDKIPMAVLRMMLQANCGGDWLFVDTDVIVQKDVRHIFDEPFDVALTDRVGSTLEGSAYAKAMPYNLGVSFSRSPGFWHEALRYLKTLPAKFQQWEGDQRVICEMVKQKLWGNIKILPGAIYNYSPKNLAENYSQASIVHFKGLRKYLRADFPVEINEWRA